MPSHCTKRGGGARQSIWQKSKKEIWQSKGSWHSSHTLSFIIPPSRLSQDLAPPCQWTIYTQCQSEVGQVRFTLPIIVRAGVRLKISSRICQVYFSPQLFQQPLGKELAQQCMLYFVKNLKSYICIFLLVRSSRHKTLTFFVLLDEKGYPKVTFSPVRQRCILWHTASSWARAIKARGKTWTSNRRPRAGWRSSTGPMTWGLAASPPAPGQGQPQGAKGWRSGKHSIHWEWREALVET